MSRSLVVLFAATAALFVTSVPVAAKTSCGGFTATNGGFHLRVRVYRIRGPVSCRRAVRLSRHVIGARCEGEIVGEGFRCFKGAPALGEPAASGYTLKKGDTVIEGRVHHA